MMHEILPVVVLWEPNQNIQMMLWHFQTKAILSETDLRLLRRHISPANWATWSPVEILAPDFNAKQIIEAADRPS